MSAALIHERLLARATQVETSEGFVDALDTSGRGRDAGEEARVTTDGETVTGPAMDVMGTESLVVDTGEERRVFEAGAFERLGRR